MPCGLRPMEIRLDDYDFELPPDRIAQEPAPEREGSRLLVLDRKGGGIETARFAEIGRYLRRGDLLVLNDTRVFPARLRARRPTGGQVEVLLLESRTGDPPRWEALVRPARAGRGRGPLALEGAPGAAVSAAAELEEGRFLVEVVRGGRTLGREEVLALCEEAGETPLPPYIERTPGDPRLARDRERYQTVYARAPGAAAAPTAGLHFSAELLARLEAAGVERTALTLAVGLGTFRPLREDALRSGRLHEEAVEVPRASAERILAARGEGRRVVAVG